MFFLELFDTVATSVSLRLLTIFCTLFREYFFLIFCCIMQGGLSPTSPLIPAVPGYYLVCSYKRVNEGHVWVSECVVRL